MKRIVSIFVMAILLQIVFGCTVKAPEYDSPFGFATCSSARSGDDYVFSTGTSQTTLLSTGENCGEAILDALRGYDVVILDGANGPFIIDHSISLDSLKGKQLLGRNGARLETEFVIGDAIRIALDLAGVRTMSDQGGGGALSNGLEVAEEREQNIRQAIIDLTGDLTERYREAGIFMMRECSDIQIRNIAFQGPGAIDVGGADLMTIADNCQHIWIDGCVFMDGMDGNLDINSGADFITISSCLFDYTDRCYIHAVSNLIGNAKKHEENHGKLHITFANCTWGEGCQGRMPRASFGTVHIYNCDYHCTGNEYAAIDPFQEAEFLVENCRFDDGIFVFGTQTPKALVTRNNTIPDDVKKPEDIGEVFIPYTY